MTDNRFYYNIIPDYVFPENGSILELGSGDGSSQLNSRHRDKFLTSEYLGIDQRKNIKPKINVIDADFSKWAFWDGLDTQFDLIIAIASIEHCSLDTWSIIADGIYRRLRPSGHFVLVVPNNEHPEEYMELDYHTMMFSHRSAHVVFGITPKLLNFFWSGIKVSMVSKPVKWRGKNPFTSAFRFLQCLFTGKFGQKYILLGVWKKE